MIINELIRLIPLISGIWFMARLYADIYRDFDKRSDVIEARLLLLEGQLNAFQKEWLISHRYMEQAIERLEATKSNI